MDVQLKLFSVPGISHNTLCDLCAKGKWENRYGVPNWDDFSCYEYSWVNTSCRRMECPEFVKKRRARA